MKLVHSLFVGVHVLMALLFALVSLALLWMAVSKGWDTLVLGLDDGATLHLVEALGTLAAAVVALQIAQTVVASVGVLLLGWGLFVHLNRSAEELEPEALHAAKSEDAAVDGT